MTLCFQTNVQGLKLCLFQDGLGLYRVTCGNEDHRSLDYGHAERCLGEAIMNTLATRGVFLEALPSSDQWV